MSTAGMKDLEEPARRFAEALIALDRPAARAILTGMTAEVPPFERVERIVVPAMEYIGAAWDQGTVALSQVYMGGRICEELMDAILPSGGTNRSHQPRMAIAVLEDYHLLGKRIVASVVRAAGFELLDYGTVQADELVSRVRNDNLDVILISVLMLPSALRIKEVSARLKQEGRTVQIVVGGAPFRFDNRLWREVGADAVGAHASEALEIIRRITGDLGR